MLQLSHILPPDTAFTTSSDEAGEATPDEQCPRSIIGALPPSAPLHLAIAHHLGSKIYASLGKHQEENVDDFTVSRSTSDRPQMGVACEYII